MLAASGEMEQARSEAERALTMVPGKSRVGQELRLLLIQVNSRLRDWDAVLAHAKGAISEGNDAPDVHWSIVWAEFSRRDTHAALRATTMRSSGLATRRSWVTRIASSSFLGRKASARPGRGVSKLRARERGRLCGALRSLT
jgi:hypothetical protein